MDILIDIAAYNAFIVHRIKYPSEYKNQSNRERLNSLDNLCQELLDPSIKIRSEKSQKNHIVFFANGKITAQDIQIDVQNVILLCAMNIQFYIVSIVNNIN